jgi:hypothetical protein
MTKEELIDRINDIEWEDFEAKEAKSELPKNIWETVSAFANTSGGWIVLGVKQNGKKFEISGVDNAEKLEQDFLGTLRSQKFNEAVDAKSMLYHIDGHRFFWMDLGCDRYSVFGLLSRFCLESPPNPSRKTCVHLYDKACSLHQQLH